MRRVGVVDGVDEWARKNRADTHYYDSGIPPRAG